jgi:hypothetical protein
MENKCGYEWGTCSPVPGHNQNFGKPSDKPHVCDGGQRHRSKLHCCATCQSVGAIVRPTPFSRAGREFAAISKAFRAECERQGMVPAVDVELSK